VRHLRSADGVGDGHAMPNVALRPRPVECTRREDHINAARRFQEAGSLIQVAANNLRTCRTHCLRRRGRGIARYRAHGMSAREQLIYNATKSPGCPDYKNPQHHSVPPIQL